MEIDKSFIISFVPITSELIAKVADWCGVTKERVQQYLSTDEQNNELFSAFDFYGVFPAGKLPQW